MSGEEHNTQRLIKDIERKDRRFRLAQSTFTVIILLVLLGVIFAQYRTLSAVQQQLSQAKEIAAQDDRQSDEQRDKIIRRLDCIVVFFQQPNRTLLTIKDIDACTLNHDGTVQQFFQQPESTPSEQPPGLKNTTNNSTTNNNQTVNPPAQPTPTEEKPAEVLGIPVCVPLTNICVRQ